ncbi:MAG: class I SAM-dependent methyltransferase [Phycisphaerae bacterium]|nr:class I SAM-dependent methyltransferase [Phycisphaerae bacterium]
MEQSRAVDRPLIAPAARTDDHGPFQAPWSVQGIDECDFYHVMELPGFGQTSGQWDLRRTVAAYLGHSDFSGKRVLDLGSASGFLTFAIEARGGSVVAFDFDAAEHIQKDLIPFPANQLHSQQRIDDMNRYSRRLKSSYWFAHRLLGSKAKAYYGDVYALPDTIGRFDVVVVAQILVHLHDPVQALVSASRLCDDTLISVEGMPDLAAPIAIFYATPDRPDLSHSWWAFSVGMYRKLLRILGFGIVSVTTSRHRCTVPGMRPMHGVTTIVARRSALESVADYEQSFRYRLRYRLGRGALRAAEMLLGEAKRTK